MGLSVTGSLLGVHVGITTGAAVTVVAGLVLLVLAVGAVRRPRFSDVPAWSMMTMGVLSLGSAADTTLGWTGFHTVAWVLGTAAGVVVFTTQCARFLRRKVAADFTGVLPLVTLMVAATNAADLGHPGIGTACFSVSLVTAVPAFVRVYLAAGRRPAPGAAATAWIPLGVVGQSTAAALLLTDGSTVGVTYAVVMLALGIPAALWAMTNHWGGLVNVLTGHAPSPNPSWWAATFPVGTCCLGTHTLATATGLAWIDMTSAGLLALLCIHVALAVTGTVSAVVAVVAQMHGR